MTYVVYKHVTIKGKKYGPYAIEVESERRGDKVVQKYVKYLGTASSKSSITCDAYASVEEAAAGLRESEPSVRTLAEGRKASPEEIAALEELYSAKLASYMDRTDAAQERLRVARENAAKTQIGSDLSYHAESTAIDLATHSVGGWGSSISRNIDAHILAFAGNASYRPLDAAGEVRSFKISKQDAEKGAKQRALAQIVLSDVFPRDKAPFVYRGMTVTNDTYSALKAGKVKDLPTTGVTAFSLSPEFAYQYAKLSEQGPTQRSVVIRRVRDAKFDATVSGYGLGAKEVVSSVKSLKIVKAVERTEGGISVLEVEVR